MKKTRFTETTIVSIIHKKKAGKTIRDFCGEQGISDATFYNWKAKYGGLEISDVKGMKSLILNYSELNWPSILAIKFVFLEYYCDRSDDIIF